MLVPNGFPLTRGDIATQQGIGLPDGVVLVPNGFPLTRGDLASQQGIDLPDGVVLVPNILSQR